MSECLALPTRVLPSSSLSLVADANWFFPDSIGNLHRRAPTRSKDIQSHLGETSGGSSIAYVRSFGSARVIGEFRDSTTGTTLLRCAANREPGRSRESGQDSLGQVIISVA